MTDNLFLASVIIVTVVTYYKLKVDYVVPENINTPNNEGNFT